MTRSTALQWLSLVGIIWLQSINGTNSNFPAYSSQLKQLLSISQLQLNNLALASDAGKLFGWFAGIAAIYLPLWLVLLIGSSLGLIGYGLQYLFLTHHITFLSYWHIFFLTVLAGNGICWINTVCYLVAIQNFPFHRQAAVGLSTCYLGLSAVIYTAAVGAFSSKPSKKAEDYMLFNSLFPLVVSIITAPFLRHIDNDKPKKVERGFFGVLVITLATGIYAVMSNLGPISRKSSPWFKVVGLGVCLTALLLIPMAEFIVHILEEKCHFNRERRVCDLTTDADEVDDRQDVENRIKDQNENIVEVKQEICAMEEIGVKLMLKRLNFWLYFFIYISGGTLGLVYLNNLGQIAESRGFARTSSLVSLASAFVFFGRLLPTALDYAYSRSKCIVPGPASIGVAMMPMAAAFFLLIINKSNLLLHFSTAIISFSTGIITAISVSTTTELFGPNNFGVNHNVVVANIPLGSFLFGGLAALLYRKEGDGHGRCLGLQCYSKTFGIWGSLCSLGIVLALVLHFRTRKFYLQRL
ncbi:protein NUCLEAR FUSION DEFECTIVE 4-like [Chenopodium quinoa]|uniref:Nodulin-like domain-containing protein n=1 Tax=Chenopodium quinoa TaxID=63459 RepID=A0A803LCX8_CHEQI|nr:protein NUCLEAR FUSION DEFECTIVE 4-like [Chenopodium quinoa]